jgi:hypothetical protein
MPIGIYFDIEKLDANTYATINQRLGEKDNPPGRTFHAAFHVGQDIHVFDVWASRDAFGAVLLPLLAERGVNPGQPRIGDIERIVTANRGSLAASLRPAPKIAT